MAALPTELGPYRGARPSAGPSTRSDGSRVGRALRAAKHGVPNWRETPFTCSYLIVVAIGTLVLSVLDRDTQQIVLRGSSTDVVHLAKHPLFVLLSSALWIDSIGDYLAAAVVLGVAASVLERRIGTRWTLAVFASGHVGATLITEGAVAFGVHAGSLPPSALSRLDVGVSYGLAAVLAALVGLLPMRARAVALVGAWVYLGFPLAKGLDMTSWGHVTAAAIGVAWWPVLDRLALANARRRFRPAALVGRPCAGMMVTWSKCAKPRWQAASWLPRRRSTTQTSRAASSWSSTMTATERSASS